MRAILDRAPHREALESLCFFAKVFASTQKLNVTLKGGLSSFSWVLLALLFAKSREGHALLGKPPSKKNRRALWLALLRYVRELPAGASLSLDGPAPRATGQLYIAVPGQPEQNAARCLQGGE